MQAFYCASDDAKKGAYPFVKRQGAGLLSWIGMFLALPVTIPLSFMHYLKRGNDKNCIKTSSTYCTGVLNSANSDVISVKKLKALASKHSASVNEIVMAITSTVLHEHIEQFKNKKDVNTVTLAIPVSFKTIPETVAEYQYGNEFTCQ